MERVGVGGGDISLELGRDSGHLCGGDPVIVYVPMDPLERPHANDHT